MAQLRILPDHGTINPRQDFCFGTMVCWHRRYNLGDPKTRQTPMKYEDIPKGSVVLPIYLYDHSGLSMRTTPFSCPWDSGQVGWIYMTPKEIRERYQKKRISKQCREAVAAALVEEIRRYNHYLQGDVYGFEFTSDSGEFIGCYEFYGSTLEETGIAHEVPPEARPLLEDAWDKRLSHE